MPTSEFVFHIRNAHPEDMAGTLLTLDSYPGLETITDIVRQAEVLGFSIHDRQRLEALMTARDLGLVEKDKNILSHSGRILARLERDKPNLFADIVHALQYTLWNQDRPDTHCFSWSYRALCRMLWCSGTTTLIGRRNMASEIESQGRIAFDRPSIAFSGKSIGGALLWIAELEPPVLVENGVRFVRRTFCSPELFMMGIDFVYRTDGVDYGANMLLDEHRRDAICQICLLDPEGFDRVLDYTVAQFDYLEKGLGGGWGRYLTLHRAPGLEDFA